MTKQVHKRIIGWIALAVMILGCVPSLGLQGISNETAASCSPKESSIYAVERSFDELATDETNSRNSLYITGEVERESERPVSSSRFSLFLCSSIFSLIMAVCLYAVYYAITEAASANLYIIRYIHAMDGLK